MSTEPLQNFACVQAVENESNTFEFIHSYDYSKNFKVRLVRRQNEKPLWDGLHSAFVQTIQSQFYTPD